MLENIKLSTCATFDRKVVVYSGFYEQESKSVEVYDQCAISWTKMPDMFKKRT